MKRYIYKWARIGNTRLYDYEGADYKWLVMCNELGQDGWCLVFCEKRQPDDPIKWTPRWVGLFAKEIEETNE